MQRASHLTVHEGTGSDPVTVLRVKVRIRVRFTSVALVVVSLVSLASPRALFDLKHPLSACSNIEVFEQIASFLHADRDCERDILTIYSIIAYPGSARYFVCPSPDARRTRYQVIACCFERGAPRKHHRGVL